MENLQERLNQAHLDKKKIEENINELEKEIKEKSEPFGAILTSYGDRKVVVKNTAELKMMVNSPEKYDYLLVDKNGFVTWLCTFPNNSGGYKNIEVL